MVVLVVLALQVAAPRAAHADGLVLQPLVGVTSSPVAMVNAGDGSGRLFIVEQEGIIRIWDGSQILDTPFLDISGPVICCGEQGLLGLAFHPDYEQPGNGYFYVNYTAAGSTSVIARYQRSAADPNIADPATALILKSVQRPVSNHNGGQLAFGPDGYLYFGIGDSGGGDPQEVAQDVQSLLGKIWRLDVDAAPPYIPPTNPLVGQPGADEIWALGMRNPWRFGFDRVTGDLFIADVGESGREEVNFQPAGDTVMKNYGWDNMEGSICFEPSSGCVTAGMTLPIIEYTHALGCSITGGYRYRGPQALLYGQYIYGDYCSGRIWAATFNGNTWTSIEQTNAPFNISTFGEGEDGELYVADYYGGVIYRVTATADIDSDGVLNEDDNCPPISNAGQQDADGDVLGDACEALYGTLNGNADSDDDGCLDGREARPATYLPGDGGDRNPADPWDFYDVTGDRAIDVADVVAILGHFGDPPEGNELYDRYAPDPSRRYRSAYAGDGIDLVDAVTNLQSFGHSCLVLP